MTWQEVKEAYSRGEFRKIAREEELNHGFSSHNHWILFFPRELISREVASGERSEWLLVVNDAIVYFLDLHIPQEEGGYRLHRLGTARPYLSDHRSRIFHTSLSLRFQWNEPIFIRMRSPQNISLEGMIITKEEFLRKETRFWMITGVYLGIFLVLVVYNFFIFLSSRERSYLYYTLYVLFASGMILVADTGFLAMMIPRSPVVRQLFASGIPLGSLLFQVLFTRRFLETSHRAPWFFRLLSFTALFLLLALLYEFAALLMADYEREQFLPSVFLLVEPVYLLLLPVILLTAALAYRRGYRPARYFLAGFSFYALFILIFFLDVFGVISLMATEFIFGTGVAGEAIILSFALTDRMNEYRRQKEAMEIRLKGEKKRISMELHDTIGTDITRLLLSLEESKREPRDLWLTRELRKVLERVRDLSTLMKRSDSIVENFEREMNEYLNGIQSALRIEIRREIQPVARQLAPELLYHTGKILREWITNLVRHSRPRSLQVRWRRTSDHAFLTICSDSTPFSWSSHVAKKASLDEKEGNGLENIRDRVAGLKGRARSLPNKNGSCFSVRIPLRREIV